VPGTSCNAALRRQTIYLIRTSISTFPITNNAACRPEITAAAAAAMPVYSFYIFDRHSKPKQNPNPSSKS